MDKAIKKIVLDLGGKEITLTPKQAQNLKKALDDLFGKEIIKVIKKEYIRDPFPIPYPVPYREPYRRPYWKYRPYLTSGDTTWQSGTTSHSFENNTLKLMG